MLKISRVVNDLIGIPYCEGGRGPEYYDCFGVLLKLYSVANIYFSGSSLSDFRKCFRLIRAPSRPLDVVYDSAWKHVLVVETAVFCVTASKALGVYREPLVLQMGDGMRAFRHVELFG